jgi:Flp pilus assembly protein TadD
MPLPRLPTGTAALRRGLIVSAALAIVLAGCAAKRPETTGSIDPQAMANPSPGDFQQAAAYWAQRYAQHPKDKTAALNYAAALRRINGGEQAVKVLDHAIENSPNDRELAAAYGKALADTGNLDKALAIIHSLQVPERPDWRMKSAEAAILDQLGRYDEARRLYADARVLAPNEPSVLSNLGMSYVLSGDLPAAEKTLREAIALPGADSRIRQNLALVVGLQGRFDEAEKIAGAELSPEQAKANVAYLKSMLAQQNNWQRLKAADVGTN